MTLRHLYCGINFDYITNFRLHTLIHTLIYPLFLPECLLHIKLVYNLIARWLENLNNTFLTAHD
jgi:hypothetical protein